MFSNFNTNPNPAPMFQPTVPNFGGLNPNPPMTNPNFQSVPGQGLLSNYDDRSQFFQRYLQKLFNQIKEQQLASDFQIIYKFLQQEQKSILTQLQKCTKIQKVTQFEQQYLKQLRERCLKLKNNNELILSQMFNIKEKFNRTLAPVLDRNFEKQQEFNILQDKIKRIRVEISTKLSHLKNKKLFDQAYNKNKPKNSHRLAPINIALTQLKDATELINRQLIKQRQEIRQLVKYLYDQSL